jgi:hypothetical protein
MTLLLDGCIRDEYNLDSIICTVVNETRQIPAFAADKESACLGLMETVCCLCLQR